MKIEITEEEVTIAVAAFFKRKHSKVVSNTRIAMKDALEAVAAMQPQPTCGCREALRSIEDMIVNCADVPRNPDSLPMTVLQSARAALASPECGVRDGLANPTAQVLDAYWSNMPCPYDLDMEDNNAAREHLRKISETLAAAPPAAQEGER